MDKVLELFLRYIQDKGIKQTKVSKDLKRDYPAFNQVCLGNRTLSRSLKKKLILWMVKENAISKKSLKDELLAWVKDYDSELELKQQKKEQK